MQQGYKEEPLVGASRGRRELIALEKVLINIQGASETEDHSETSSARR